MSEYEQLRTDLAAANKRAEKAAASRDICVSLARKAQQDRNTLRTLLALAEKQRDEAVEALEDDIREIEPAIYILETSPKECLGITGDDFNSWPIRDELISDLKKRLKENLDTIARIREMGEKGGKG